MAIAPRKKSKRAAGIGRGNTLMNSVKKHPLRTAGIAGGVVLGAALLAKAANTAAKVITIKAATDAATDVAHAVRGGSRRKR